MRPFLALDLSVQRVMVRPSAITYHDAGIDLLGARKFGELEVIEYY